MPATRSRPITAATTRPPSGSRTETGIQVFKFNVGDFASCQEGIAKVESELGPVEVLVNNAGITRDTTIHRMSFEQWKPGGDSDQSFVVLQHVEGGHRGHARAQIRPYRCSMSARSTARLGNTARSTTPPRNRGHPRLHRCRRWPRKARRAASPSTPRRARLQVDTDMVRAVPPDVFGKDRCPHPGRPPRQGRGHRPHRPLPLIADDADFITGSTLSVNGGQHG